MGRAIDVDNRLSKLEFDVRKILLILDELGKTGSKQKRVDLDEEIKKEKTNTKTDRGSDGKSDKGNKSKSTRNPKNSKSIK